MGGSSVWDVALLSIAYAWRYGVFNTLSSSREVSVGLDAVWWQQRAGVQGEHPSHYCSV